MSEGNGLPAGWVQAKVEDLFSTVGGGTPSTDNPEYWEGDIPWITSADINEDHSVTARRKVTEEAISASATNKVPMGSVVVATRVGLGKVGLAPEDLCFSQDCQALLFDSRYFDPVYVVYQMRVAVAGFKFISRGTTISGVTKKQLLAVDFLLPPLAEQRRIVAAIEEQFTRLDAGMAALERARKGLKRYRASVLKAAVEGRLTKEWREENPGAESGSALLERILEERRERWEVAQLARYTTKEQKPPKNWRSKYKEPAAPDTADLPELPEGWCWASLPQIGQFDRGKSKHRPRNAAHLYGGPYPFIQTGDVRHAGTFIKEYKQTYSETGLAQSKLWPAGTLCITIAANIAETSILAFDACFPDSVVGFAAPKEAVSTQYVEIYLRTIQQRLETYAPATAQKNINIETLQSVAIALPPFAEQEEIVAEVERRLSVIEEVEAQVEAGLKRAARLRQSILKRAFGGRLVPQDPSDEPASVLLDRIREEREKTTTKKSQRKKSVRQSPKAGQVGLF